MQLNDKVAGRGGMAYLYDQISLPVLLCEFDAWVILAEILTVIATSERAPASELGASYSLLTGKIELFRWIVFSTPLAGSLYSVYGQYNHIWRTEWPLDCVFNPPRGLAIFRIWAI